MTTLAPTLPPPLSAPPSVAMLQGLLDGLQQPMQRGVPSPPAVHAAALGRDRAAVDITLLERATPDPTPRAAPLTWSAGRARSHPRRTAAVATAAAVAAGVLGALAAAGELGLP